MWKQELLSRVADWKLLIGDHEKAKERILSVPNTAVTDLNSTCHPRTLKYQQYLILTNMSNNQVSVTRQM